MGENVRVWCTSDDWVMKKNEEDVRVRVHVSVCMQEVQMSN